jgi:hypothetical protein
LAGARLPLRDLEHVALCVAELGPAIIAALDVADALHATAGDESL